MTPSSSAPSTPTPTPTRERVGTPEYARLRAQASGFQFAGTLVTRYLSTVELAREAR